MTIRNYTTFDPAALQLGLSLEQSDTVLSTYSTAVAKTCKTLYYKSAGAWYVEWVLFGAVDAGAAARVGVARATTDTSGHLGASAGGIAFANDGRVWHSGTQLTIAPSWGLGDVIGMLVDFPATTLWLYRNGSPVYSLALDLDHIQPFALVPAASLVQGANDGGADKISLLLSAGQRRFEYLSSDTLFPGGVSDGASMPNAGWFEPAAGIGMFRLADRSWMTAPDDAPPNTPYHDAIAAGSLMLADSLNFWPWGGRASTPAATLRVYNADAAFDALLAGDARDADVVLRLGDGDAPLASAAAVAKLRVDSITANDDGNLQIGLTDASSRLGVALQQRLILPTADASAANKPWPWGVGTIRSGEAVNMRAADRIYAANDGAVAGIGAVRDRGDPFDPSLGDYVFDQAAGTMQLDSEAQGRVTLDFSTLGGDLPEPPQNLLGSIGTFVNSSGWTLGAGWTISAGAARFSRGSSSTTLLSIKTTSNVLTAGRVYRVKLDVSKLADTLWGQSVSAPPSLAYLTIASDKGNGTADPSSTWGRVYPLDASGLRDLGTVSFVGVARRTGPLHICIWPGSIGAAAVIDNAVLWEVAQEQLDDEALVPATLEQALRALLEGRAGLRPDEWSADDAAAIDTATGYAGIGYYARSDAAPTVADALQEILDSYCACTCIDDDGVLRIVQLRDPALEDADVTIDASVIRSDAQVSIDLAPGLTTQMQGRKNWAPLAPSEMVSDDVGLPYGITGGVE